MKLPPSSFDSFVKDHLPPLNQWPAIINRECVDLEEPFNCAVELLDKAIDEGHGDKIAIYSPNENWTYLKLEEKVNQISHVLTEDLGMIPGNRVLLRSANNPMLAACWLAVVKAGGIVVSTIAMLRAREISMIAQQSQADIALCDYRLKEDMVKAVNELEYTLTISYFNDSNQKDSLESLMANKPKTFSAHIPNDSDTIALMGFTSGTTGKPKGAVHSHHGVMAVCDTFSKQILKPTPDDIFAGTPPLAFVYGLGGLLLFPLHARASTVMLEDVRPSALVDAINKFKITIIHTAPTTYKALLETTDIKKLTSLKIGVSAGEALPSYVSQDWYDQTGIRIIDGLGSTELLHIFLSVQNKQCPMGSLGKAVPGYETCVLDKEGKKVPNGLIGYLAAKGPTGCRYVNDDRQTSYVVNGWNITGDTVIEDEDGYYWYHARTDGMIISSGYNIAAPEVEHTIALHPAVTECAVIGVPDKARGNIVRAYVVLKKEHTPNDELIKDIQDFAKQNGAPYKYPRSIKFIDALPRTPTGKIQHFVLREQAEMEATAN